MTKKFLSYLIVFLILTITTVNVSALYFEASDDNYAKKAETIALKTYAFPTNLDEDSITIAAGVMLINFQSDKWIIACSELNTQKPIFACVCTLTEARINDNNDLFFMGEGKNTTSGQIVIFMLHVINEAFYLGFHSENEDELLRAPYNAFFIHQNHSDNYVLFKDIIDISGDFSTKGWKMGTTSQIKKCLIQNPYLEKW